MKIKITAFVFLLNTLILLPEAISQVDTIKIKNASFEDVPKQGGSKDNWSGIKNWVDCAPLNRFIGETPPDIHPNGWWGNSLPASDGNTYLGMVTRDNNTYESVGQRLDSTLKGGKCYDFTINLARAPTYVSPTRTTGLKENYNTPIVLRIWGGNTLCDEGELLAESVPVNNDSWQIFNFEFRPKSDVRYIIFSAFYKTPALLPYNGNILVDGGSLIIQTACPGDPPLYVDNTSKKESKLPPHKQKKSAASRINNTTSSGSKASVSKSENNQNKTKILTELNRKQLKEGQTIEIKNLFFKEDSSAINVNSYEVLDELHDFLLKNSDVIIEIGGHTNNVPSHEYCNQLSTQRAKVVAQYLIKKGIAADKIQFKGYGKRMPIADNKTPSGRKKNQRVEIKILSLNG